MSSAGVDPERETAAAPKLERYTSPLRPELQEYLLQARLRRRGRPLAIVKTLEAAHRLREQVAGFADLREAAAALGHTPARLEQLLELTELAPEIQLQLFRAELDDPGQISERTLIPVLQSRDWEEQRRQWSRLRQARLLSAMSRARPQRGLHRRPALASRPAELIKRGSKGSTVG